MLKQVGDTILVTGPFKINGVPLRRINPAYVIATSTKVDLSKADLSLDKFDEAYFKVKKEKKGKSTEEEFFGEGEKVTTTDINIPTPHYTLTPRKVRAVWCGCLGFGTVLTLRRRKVFPSRGRRIRRRLIRLSFPSLPKRLI